ncbi:MAG: hypothetical protein QM743_05795 [Chitinophagaceae bacterium]
MKKIAIISMLLVSALSAGAQTENTQENSRPKPASACKPFSLGLPLGIGANAGLIGIGAEYGFARHFSAGVGAGIGSWGYKYFGEAKYYFKDDCFKGSALGLAYTYAAGISDVDVKGIETVYGKKDVKMDLDPVSNLAVAYYHYWGMGRRRVNRFYLSVGYSVCLSSVTYTVKGYPVSPLTSQGTTTMNVLAPGGLVLGLGFYFGL